MGPDLSVIALSVVKQGDNDIEGLTDRNVPKRLGPKRASKIRKMFVSNVIAYDVVMRGQIRCYLCSV